MRSLSSLDPGPADMSALRPIAEGPRSPPEPRPAIHRLLLDLDRGRLAELERHLSPGELAVATRFATRALRDRFVAARGQLREILGRAQGLPARYVPIEVGRWGKPYVAAPGAVRFSLSHSADRAVCATSARRSVGVDIERTRPCGEEPGIGRLVFTARESAALSAQGRAARAESFCRLWACKEAICKADGRGFALDPRSFEVPPVWLPGAARAEGLSRGVVLAGGRLWSVALLDAPPGFAIALALEVEPAAALGRGGSAPATPP